MFAKTLHLHDKLMSNLLLQYKKTFFRTRDPFPTSNPNINTMNVKEQAPRF